MKVRSGFRCAKCRRKLSDERWEYMTLDVHHLSYEHLWNERMNELQVLCRACHEREHKGA